MSTNGTEPFATPTYLESSVAPSSGNVTAADAAGLHPATVAGASVGTIILVLLVLIVVLFFVAYHRFPQKLLKWILNLHLRVAGLRRKSAISSVGE